MKFQGRWHGYATKTKIIVYADQLIRCQLFYTYSIFTTALTLGYQQKVFPVIK
jgi:hypothetical protein